MQEAGWLQEAEWDPCQGPLVTATSCWVLEDLREPLVRRQGSQVSMRVARGSASWLSSHGRAGPLGTPLGLVHTSLGGVSFAFSD